MKKFFVFVFAVTLAIIMALAGAGGAWWYLDSRPPDLDARLERYMDIEREGEIRWLLAFEVANGDSKDYTPGEWKLLRTTNNGSILPFKSNLTTMEDNILYGNSTTLVFLLTETKLDEPLFSAPDEFFDSPSLDEAKEHLKNLERFKEEFGTNMYWLVNDKLGFKQQVSFKSYYDEQHRQRTERLEKAQSTNDMAKK